MAESSENSKNNVSSEEEPKLKYHRMSNDVSDILVEDTITCITIHPKFVCLGSQWGSIYIFDHEGNIVKITSESGTKYKTFHMHTIAVNHISVDTKGDYIATCSDDGKIFIHGLYSSENNLNMSLGKVIKSIALDPSYYKAGVACRFLVGDNKLTLYEKNFFNRIKSTVLCECEGYVQAIAWQDRFVAWAGDIGVRVYDIVARCSLGLIKWDINKSVIDENYRCNLIWSTENVIMIGWIDTVRICSIRKRNKEESQSKLIPEYLVDPLYMFQTNYFICGLAPLNNQLIILGYPKEKDCNTGKAQRPALSILDYKEHEFFEISSDSIKIQGYEEFSCNDYRLACLIEENRFFIVSPKDVIIASQYDIDDRIQWLIEHDFFQKAIDILKDPTNHSSKHTIPSVGVIHMDHLLEKNEYEKAALLYSEICSIDTSLWEKEICKFANINALRFIAPYVPTTVEEMLSSHVYELILYEHLKFHPQGFLNLVQKWDSSLYKINSVISVVIQQLLLSDNNKPIYLESLAILYCKQKKFDKALSIYLKLQHKDVFELIEKHFLYSFIHDKILSLMQLDCEKTISLLVEKDKRKVPIEIVEEQLKSNKFYLFKYFDALNRVDNCDKYHGTLVSLYAEFSRDKLLNFLKCSDKYPIQDALNVCEEKKFYPETVYLLGRIGNIKDALDIIIKKIGDINQAISFCQEHDDKELWMDLITYSLDKPMYIVLLLKRIGNYMDPRILIQGIKSDCKIDNLKDSLAKMMSDFNLQLSVQEACKAITLRNYFDLQEKLINNHNKGVCISDEYLCSACHGKIIVKDVVHVRNMIVYNCRHVFHTGCISEMLRQDICALCHSARFE